VEIIYSTFKKEEILNNYWGCVQQTIQRFGDKAFIVTKQGSLTYAEANQHANVIFEAVRGMKAETGLGVGLFMKDPLQIIPAMIGVLKSRNYFIPLDVSFPEATLHSMFENAGIKVILTVDQFADQIRSLVGKTLAIIILDELEFEREIPDPVVDYSLDDIVQILFTSGSTGQPKGAIEDYRYLTRAAFIKIVTFGYELDERILHLSTFTYSAQHILVFTALLNGLTICYYSMQENGISGLPEWIRQQVITGYITTATVFRGLVSILNPDEKFPSVHTFQLSGEKRLHKDIEAIKKHFPNADRFVLSFSATETQSVSSSIVQMNYIFGQKELPSGKPYDDLKVYIWDGDGKELPPGAEGEIVVYGDSLARGYINNPELTRERFIPDPDNSIWQYFKTGDLGKLLPDGQLVHLGRMDNMVKIKGVRIELDSIENHMRSYPGIVQVASRAIEDQKGNKRLASYFVSEKGIQIPISDLRKHLAERLPRNMLPHYLISLDALPLTGSGKVALSQLPLPEMVRPALSNDYAPAADELERKLVEIWEEQVGIDGIGVTDDFFEVGGDSLIGVLLFVRIEEVLGRNLPVSVLLSASTIRKQAELLRNEGTDQDFSPVIPINTMGGNSPLFFIPGKGGYPTRIRHLAKKLDPQTPVYALQDLMSDQQGRAFRSIESVASFYLKEIQKIFLQGPYILVGESMGGKIAYEMAQQLLKEGKKVRLLVLLDTYNMENSAAGLGKRKREISYYGMLVKKHLTILIKSDRQGRLDYLRFYWETTGTMTRRIMERRSDRTKRTGDSALPENVRRIETASRQAGAAYAVKPYPGRVILFKALRGPNSKNPSNGWGQIELGELSIHTLDCYHGSILFEPAVSHLAAILQAHILENIPE